MPLRLQRLVDLQAVFAADSPRKTAAGLTLWIRPDLKSISFDEDPLARIGAYGSSGPVMRKAGMVWTAHYMSYGAKTAAISDPAMARQHIMAICLDEGACLPNTKLSCYPKLAYASLQNNALCEALDLPECVNLVQLNLALNLLVKAPNLSRLTQLLCLDLSDNRLRTVSALASLPCLRELALSNNLLTSLDGLGTLAVLEQLYVGNNLIATLQEVFQIQACVTILVPPVF